MSCNFITFLYLFFVCFVFYLAKRKIFVCCFPTGHVCFLCRLVNSGKQTAIAQGETSASDEYSPFRPQEFGAILYFHYYYQPARCGRLLVVSSLGTYFMAMIYSIVQGCWPPQSTSTTNTARAEQVPSFWQRPRKPQVHIIIIIIIGIEMFVLAPWTWVKTIVKTWT